MFKIFKITTSTSNWFIKFVHKHSNVIAEIGVCSLVVFVVSSLLATSIQFMLFLLPVAYTSFILMGVCMILEPLSKVPLSLRYFMGYGIVYWFITVLILYSVLLLFISTDNITSIILIYIVSFITWMIYSLLANNKVARLANFLLSSVLAIAVLGKDLILSFLPEEYIAQIFIIPEGYTGSQVMDLAFNIIFTPILIMNIFAMSICELKGYWIEKYNDGKDVGDE